MESIKNIYIKANKVRSELLLFTDKEIQDIIKQYKNRRYLINNPQDQTIDYSYLTCFEEKYTYSQEIKYGFMSYEKIKGSLFNSPAKILSNIKTSRGKDNSKCSTNNTSSKLRNRYNTIINNKEIKRTPLVSRNNSCILKERIRRKSCFNISRVQTDFPSSKNKKKNMINKKKGIKNLGSKSKVTARRFLRNLCFSFKRNRGRLESSNLFDKFKNKYENKIYKKNNNENSNNNLNVFKNMNFMSCKRIKDKRQSAIPSKNIKMFSNINIINNLANKKRKSLFFRKSNE